MLVDPNILEDLYSNAGLERKQKAQNYVKQKKVKITKVLYDNFANFELKSIVIGNYDIYNVYIKVEDNELTDVRCECPDYKENYGACKHIVASMIEFSQNIEYKKLFNGSSFSSGEKENKHKENDKYRAFKQLINTFYNEENKNETAEKVEKINNNYLVKIEPKLIFNTFNKSLKIEFKIGNKQLYKLKNLPEFYDRMLKNENYSYGAKLNFVHNKESFEEESKPILGFILKHAEIIKYVNESTPYYGTILGSSNITISNSGLDELFEILKGKYIEFETEYANNNKIFFKDEEPDTKFYIEKDDSGEYVITTDMDVYSYEILEGKEYLYFLYKNVLHRCSKEFASRTLKLIEVFKGNYVKEIKIPKKDLGEMFSLIFPLIEKNVSLEKIEREEVDKYIPKELFVKLYLDFNEANYIIADIKFVYGDEEFNPFKIEDLNIARNISKENEILEMFMHTGFLLDKENDRLILVNEEKIYNFLSVEIEDYMKKFEVLATDNFKKKEIKEPKIGNIGVRIENNLLKVDFSNLDFNLDELSEIMKKYHLKKKYHRLKDGRFLELEQSETIEFLDSITEKIDIDYSKIQKQELKLPMYRSMYLDKLLEKLPETNVEKDLTYKGLIENISKKDINEEIQIPKGLNANFRNYQKIGFKWLKILEKYHLGGILADDMGLGKTIQLIAILLSYKENTDNPKPSIVISPSSLCLNWKSEVEKFAPDIKTVVVSGDIEQRTRIIKSIPDYDLIITSYDLLKRDIDLYKELNYDFKYAVADEAQYIKNSNTQNAKAIKEIMAEVRYALTGTPIENSLSELWSIFDFIMPGYLFSYRKFKELYEVPIAKENDENTLNKLKMLIEPFVLRRIKKDVLLELPDKTITVLNNEMQGEQLKIYSAYMAKAKKEATEEINLNGFERSQIKILALLMRLRQICCHPTLFLNDYKGESSKLNQCIEIVKDAVNSGHKILLFSGYTSMFNILEETLKNENIKYFKLTGQTKVGDRIKLVDEFNQNEEVKVFLISLKAGGTGLNLTGADMVIHYDPWWNLSIENQATDRTYRIGQKRNVQVYKLITKNSIEERIYELQKRKAKLADSMLSTNATFINQLSKEDIMSLFE